MIIWICMGREDTRIGLIAKEGKPCTWLELSIILVTEHRMHVGKTTADHTVPLVT